MPKRIRRHKQDVCPLISRIEVEKLFYTYSYILKLTPTPDLESGRLMLLYGENGSGKTTILNLIYHLLNPEPYGGHRSFVGRVPFKTFRVHLPDGVVVSASRSRKYDPGNYTVQVKHPSKKSPLRWEFRASKTRLEERDEPEYMAFCSILNKLGLSFHYLRDTRRIEGSRISSRSVLTRRMREASEALSLVEGMEEEEELLLPEKQLTSSVDVAIQWFRQRALSATNIGYTSVNTIYRDIIKRIVKERPSQQEATPAKPDELTRALIDLKEKNSEFARFGLTPELDVKDIVTNLEAAKPKHLSMLDTVFRPYLKGHAARLDALKELQRVMSSFVSLLCEFYSHKKASVHLEKGLKITADTGQELDPLKLSSGEKQLLLLFCNAISSRQDRTILMIDEPEISLNVRWQRELIPALITCMSGTSFQLILATHSVELLGRYQDCVIPLDNMREAKPNE